MSKRKRKKSVSSGSVKSAPRVIKADELSFGVAELVKSVVMAVPVERREVRPARKATRPSDGNRGLPRAEKSGGYKGGKPDGGARWQDKGVSSNAERGEFDLPEVEASEWAFDHDSSPDFTYMYGGRLKVGGDGSSIWPTSRGVYDPHDMSRGLVPVVSLDQPYWIEDSISFTDVK